MEKIVLGDDPDVKGGVYVLRVGRWFYFGKAANMRARRNAHFGALRRGVHHNPVLQNAYKKHGEDHIAFEPVIWCSKEDAANIEAELIQSCWKIKECANLRLEDGFSYTMSEESRRRIGDSNRGKPKSESHKRSCSEAAKRRHMQSPMSQETRQKLREANYKRNYDAVHAARSGLGRSPVLVINPAGESLYFLSARSVDTALGQSFGKTSQFIRGHDRQPKRLAGYRFSYLDKTRENWSIFPTACTHEHYGSATP